MTSPEFREVAPQIDFIKGNRADIHFINPTNIRSYLESQDACNGIYFGETAEFAEPIVGTSMEYKRDLYTDEIEIIANVAFSAKEVISTPEQPWEKVLNERLLHKLSAPDHKKRAPEVLKMPYATHGFCIVLDNEYTAHVQFLNETQGCEVKISLVNTDQARTASGQELRDYDDEPKESYELLKKVSELWLQTIDVVGRTYGKQSRRGKRTTITFQAPNTQTRYGDAAPPNHAAIIDKPTNTAKSLEDAITFGDIAGYEEAKKKMLRTATLHKHPELAKNINLSSTTGILLYGPAGTGKTQLAHAFANEIDANLIELRVSQIIDKWVGSSTRNLDDFFDELEKLEELTVVFMDEIDSLAVSSEHASSGERIDTVNRMKERVTRINQKFHNIILVGATNSLDRVDKNLTRPERFEKIEIPMPDEVMRQKIWTLKIGEIGLRAMILEIDEPVAVTLDVEGVDINELAAKTYGMVGAHFTQILNNIKMDRLETYIETGEMDPIRQSDLLKEIKAIQLDD